MNELPILLLANQEDWRQWLAQHFGEQGGVWLKFAKQGTGASTVNYAQALDVALCYGWIDGQAKRFDETYYLQKFTPRRARSMWSKRNREHVARLIAEGKMQAPGLCEIDRAKADGRWEAAYDSPSNMKMPDDFQAALNSNPAAKEFFATLNGANRYAILWRLQDAKRPETRSKRMEKFIAMLAAGEKLH